MKKQQYARYVKFLRDTIADAGCTKTSGKPNVDEFYTRFAPALNGTGLKLSKTSFGNQVAGVANNPFGQSLEAMAVILSAARGEKVTVADLDSLIDRKSLSEFEQLAAALLPTSEAAASIRAEHLLKALNELPIDARAVIAPCLLRRLSDDWRYLDSPQHVKVSKLLQNELNRRGIGPEAFAKLMGDVVPAEVLLEIRECRILEQPLTTDQILALQKHMRSIDGDEIEYDELQCLAQRLRPLK